MAGYERRQWQGSPTGQTYRDRRPCNYDTYLPDPLAGRDFALSGEVTADVAAAEAALVRLDESATALAGSHSLARLILRAESVASSRIEGLVVGGRRLLRADAARRLGNDPRDRTAEEVLANIDAMSMGVETVGPGDPIEPAVLLEMHRLLLAGTPLEKHGGRLRDRQNWIGSSGYNPCAAAFVPPPPEIVEDLFDDLCAFASADAWPPLVQAAITHAQFETIHPFVDGNGRVGRALIHLVLRRRGLGLRVQPPISLVLATWSSAYVAGLTATRYVGPSDSTEARDGFDRWVALAAEACLRAAGDAARFEERVQALQAEWLERAGPARGGSALRLLIDALPEAPVLTTSVAADLIGRSLRATTQAMDQLVRAGILVQITVGRRNRAFEAPELIEAFTAFERGLASPEGDTTIADPSRPVPQRPN